MMSLSKEAVFHLSLPDNINLIIAKPKIKAYNANFSPLPNEDVSGNKANSSTAFSCFRQLLTIIANILICLLKNTVYTCIYYLHFNSVALQCGSIMIIP